MKIGIVIPYFGKLPDTFNIWLVSAASNLDIDFHLITDQDLNIELPRNIFIHLTSFRELRIKIKATLNADMSSPYKLCDYKPTYGYLFKDILNKYDYWGYSDIDLIYGNLSEFIRDENIFGVYDKIFELGHLSFYRNTPAINELFRTGTNNCWSYISRSQIIWVFDELYSNQGIPGINQLLIDHDFKIYENKVLYSDVNPALYGFTERKENHKNRSFFQLANGALKRTIFVENNIKEINLIYAHFQKREIQVINEANGSILVVPQHWKNCTSYDDALEILRSEFPIDFERNKLFDSWKQQKHKRKKFLLFKESFQFRCLLNLTTRSILKKGIRVFRQQPL